MNQTHGQIVANVSIANGHPTPINVTVYQARTVNGTQLILNKKIYSLNIFLSRRDFRLLKLDPSTKQVVANPIVWVEMNGTEIV